VCVYGELLVWRLSFPSQRERERYFHVTKTKRKEERETEKKERRATQIICINCSTQHTQAQLGQMMMMARRSLPS
jgi:hypothetical protein